MEHKITGVTNAFRRSGASGRISKLMAQIPVVVTNAFRRSGASGHCRRAQRHPVHAMSPMPFGGAERVAWLDDDSDGEISESHQCLSAERSEWPGAHIKAVGFIMSPMPFGGAERVAWDQQPYTTRLYCHQCLSAERSEWPPDSALITVDGIDVTNAFRRSGASGRNPPAPLLNFSPCHQCLSAERSEWPMLVQLTEGQERPRHSGREPWFHSM